MAFCVASIRRWAGIIRDFTTKGQLLDLAVAFAIGDSLTKLVQSFVNTLITPILGFLFDGTAIEDLTAKLQSDRWRHKPPVILRYGEFIQQIIFSIIIVVVLAAIVAFVHQMIQARRNNQIVTEPLPSRQELILKEHTQLLKIIAQSLKK